MQALTYVEQGFLILLAFTMALAALLTVYGVLRAVCALLGHPEWMALPKDHSTDKDYWL